MICPFKDWERWHQLKEIKVRALTIGSNHDEMDLADMRKMATLMPNATYTICPNGSHNGLVGRSGHLLSAPSRFHEQCIGFYRRWQRALLSA
jgi:hypothetical protein